MSKSKIVDQGVASCPNNCAATAPFVIEETDDGRLDSVVSCPNCGEVRREGLDDHEDFPPGRPS
jgi:hypothetical protein